MNELIEHIRAAVAQGATAEQKSIGAQACRTILSVLEAQPGKPIVLPGAPAPTPMSRLSLDQALDLLIARLSTVAAAQDTPTAQMPPRPRGLRVPTTPASSPVPPASSRTGRKP